MKTVKAVARSSPLSLIQVEEIRQSAPFCAIELIPLLSTGDRQQAISLLNGEAPRDFFTDTLDDALLAHEADIAIHSAKDLPFPLHPLLDVIALLPPKDQTDSLVSRASRQLANLPLGAKIGTSSPARRDHLLSQRPDLTIVGIRGTIEQRIALIERDGLDGVIVATCALERLGRSHEIAERLPFPTHPLQGMLAITARRDRPDLRALFAPIDNRKSYGKVILVGAGPGSADLISLRGRRALDKADVVLYDDLSGESLLENISAELLYVGKRAGNHALPQEEICALMYAHAIRGRRVVRLKGGDPFIFGRGGEEVRYLQERWIAVEVIPGISAAQAAAARSLSPLTERGISSSLLLSTAQVGPAGEQPPTRVWYMGAASREKIRAELLAAGATQTDAVTLVHGASHSDESVIRTTVSDMQTVEGISPLIIIAGNVGRDRRDPPKLLYTGIDDLDFPLDGALIHHPMISTEQTTPSRIDIDRFDALLFCSPRAVEYFPLPGEWIQNHPIIAIGKATIRKLAAKGLQIAHQPDHDNSDSVNTLVSTFPYRSILYPCSSLSSNILHRAQTITPWVVYTTKFLTPKRVDPTGFDGIIFTSPSTIDAYLAHYTSIPAHCVIYVRGPMTEKHLYACGCSSDRVIAYHTPLKTD